jgi:PEP-CTERM motif
MKRPKSLRLALGLASIFTANSVQAAATFYTSSSAFNSALVNPFTENISTSTAGRSIIAQNYNITTGADEVWAQDVYSHDANHPLYDPGASLAGTSWNPSSSGPFGAYRTTADYIPATGAFTEFTGTEMRFVDFGHFAVNLSGGPYYGIGWNAFESIFAGNDYNNSNRDSKFLVSAYNGSSTIPVVSFEWDVLSDIQISAGASSFFGFTSDDAFTRLTFRELSNDPILIVGDSPPYQPGDEGPEFFNRFTASTALAAVPEPSTSILAGAALACGLIRRRR